jgi:hypothetical protein
MSIHARTSVLAFLFIHSGFAWGPAGHRIVALIAEQRLTPEVRARVTHLLLDGQFSMAQISSCPDALRGAERVPLKPEDEFCLKIAAVPSGSGPWHYIDIPILKPRRTLAAYCPNGNCVTAKITQFRDVLRNSNDDAQRREALMYLVHFMGDIHMPLHCAERECDQGGNQEHVTVTLHSGIRADRRLHAAWDIDFVDKLMEEAKINEPPAFAALLASGIQPKKAAAWQGASIEDMAWEGWELAKKHAYEDIPDLNYCDPEVKAAKPEITLLSPDYEQEADKVVRRQLMKAGVRLANLLNENLTR